MHWSQIPAPYHNHSASMELPQKTTAENFAQYVPGTLIAVGQGAAWTDVFFEIYTRRRVEESIIVPAVAEPLIVWVVSGSALVEEREFGGEWSGRLVQADDFFLTTSATPYELRWRAQGADPLLRVTLTSACPRSPGRSSMSIGTRRNCHRCEKCLAKAIRQSSLS